jgi:hypothetical protein
MGREERAEERALRSAGSKCVDDAAEPDDSGPSFALHPLPFNRGIRWKRTTCATVV